VTGVVDRQAAILAARSYPAATTGAAVRITGEQRGARVVICVDGRLIEAHEGEMVAAALMAAGIYRLRQSPNAGTARGAFCLMGVCQECVIQVAGELRQSCMVSVVAGLEVETLPTTGEA
jgi:predicted molibdopterin-dependent oxidoreductase YjgC